MILILNILGRKYFKLLRKSAMKLSVTDKNVKVKSKYLQEPSVTTVIQQWWDTESSSHTAKGETPIKNEQRRKQNYPSCRFQKLPQRAEPGLSSPAVNAVLLLPLELLGSFSSDFGELNLWPPLRVLEQSQHPSKETTYSSNEQSIQQHWDFLQCAFREQE